MYNNNLLFMDEQRNKMSEKKWDFIRHYKLQSDREAEGRTAQISVMHPFHDKQDRILRCVLFVYILKQSVGVAMNTMVTSLLQCPKSEMRRVDGVYRI